MGVHLTFLRPDGNDKAGGVEDAKLTGCKGSTGSPICLAPPNDLLGFSVTEGIEDALPIHEATGLGSGPGRPVRQDACRPWPPTSPTISTLRPWSSTRIRMGAAPPPTEASRRDAGLEHGTRGSRNRRQLDPPHLASTVGDPDLHLDLYGPA